ncbi:MAG: hypothetical protein IT436_07510 [Phycisphaerales bacterium]|nr:hypothetical protein [Phycisphaerales bacterium]
MAEAAPQPNSESLDLTEGDVSRAGPAGRPWIQVWFRCAGRYLRVFRHHDGSGYTARCASCGKCIRFRTGPGGTSQRRFDVDCRS